MSTPWHTPFYFPPIPTHPQPSTYETTNAGTITHTDINAILDRPSWSFTGANVRAWLAMQDAGWVENAEGVMVPGRRKNVRTSTTRPVKAVR